MSARPAARLAAPGRHRAAAPPAPGRVASRGDAVAAAELLKVIEKRSMAPLYIVVCEQLGGHMSAVQPIDAVQGQAGRRLRGRDDVPWPTDESHFRWKDRAAGRPAATKEKT